MLALALRAWPLHVFYQHPDQGFIPDMAAVALRDGHWHPWYLAYPGGQMDVLRFAYTIAYGVGLTLGRYHDRLDFFGHYLDHQWAYLLVGRVWACLAGTATVLATAWLGARTFGSRCGLVAGLVLAVSFGHVRESHWGMNDAPATFFIVATLLAADRYRRHGRARDLVLAGVLAGVAAGFRYQAVIVALTLPIVVAMRTPRTLRSAGRLGLAAVASAATFCVLSPYTFLERTRFLRDMAPLYRLTYQMASETLPLGTLLAAGNGVAPCVLAIVGAAIALWRWPRPTAYLLVVPVAVLAIVWRATRLFLRYLLPLGPFVALFASVTLVALADLAPTRWRRAALVALVLATVAEPAARTISLDRLLATPDTRIAAGEWIMGHVPPGSLLLLPDTLQNYGNPILRPPAQRIWYGAPLLEQLLARGHFVPTLRYASYGPDGSMLRAVWQPDAYLVTLEHPVAFLGQIPPVVATTIAQNAEIVARFTGLRPGAKTGALFEPIDASAFPLRGFDALTAPGPDIVVWKLRAAPPSPAS